MAFPLVGDKLTPRNNNKATFTLSLFFYYIFHPIVMLSVALMMALERGMFSEFFKIIPWFVMGMLFLKGVPIYVFGVKTDKDASLHVGSSAFSITFVMFVLLGEPILFLPVLFIPLGMAFTVWHLRSHNLLGIILGALIGFLPPFIYSIPYL